MDSSKYIKSYLSLNAVTIKQLAALLTEKTGRKYTQGSLTSKLFRNSITFDEAFDIAEVLGYKLEFTPNN